MIPQIACLNKSFSFCLILGLAISCSRSTGENSSPKLVRSLESVSVSTGLDAWNQKILKNAEEAGIDLNAEGYMECAAVSEIKGAYLCASSHAYDMNRAFARATIFTEGSYKTAKKTVVSNKSSAYAKALGSFGGHDLKSEHLAEYWKAAETACNEGTDKDLCATDEEKRFFETFVLPKLANNETFVVVSYSIQFGMDWRDVVTHEIMHAQYFLEPAYREGVDAFWQDKVIDTDKEEIKFDLSKIYDVNDEFLIKNEFQAYILQRDAKKHNLSRFVDIYLEPLTAALKEKGVVPVQVDTTDTRKKPGRGGR